jgi:hypothetical protein
MKTHSGDHLWATRTTGAKHLPWVKCSSLFFPEVPEVDGARFRGTREGPEGAEGLDQGIV